MRRSDAERDEVLISAGELLNEGLQRGAGGQASAQPFTYTEFSDTHLNKVYFYAYDHLGNTRVTYSQDCKNWNNVEPSDEDDVNIEYAADYYPYGKVLREFVNERAEKYLTTLHQRDEETGLDYRGARYYDSDVARFLSLDPRADEFVDMSAYNYVFGNPVSIIDPDGRGGWDVVKGFAIAMAENAFGTPWSNWRSIPSYNNAGDYNRGQDMGDAASMLLGGFMIGDGGAKATAGGVGLATAGTIEGATVGAGTPVAVPVAGASGVLLGAGALEATFGGYLVLNAKSSLESRKGRVTNPNGSKGNPDHQEKVGELESKARSEAGEGEQVVREKKIQGHESNRRPDVQIVDRSGKARKVYEAERNPGRKRNIQRQQEYDRLEIEHETHKVKP